MVMGSRIVSFFKDEPIVGAYLSGFIFFDIWFFIKKNIKNQKFFTLVFFIFTFLIILISGERSNSIKIFFGLILMFFIF